MIKTEPSSHPRAGFVSKSGTEAKLLPCFLRWDGWMNHHLASLVKT